MPMDIRKIKTCPHFSIQKNLNIRVLPKLPLFLLKVDHTPLLLPRAKNRFLSGNIFWMQIRKQRGEKKKIPVERKGTDTSERFQNLTSGHLPAEQLLSPYSLCITLGASIWCWELARSISFPALFQLPIYMPGAASLQIVLDNPFAEAAASETSCWAGAKFISRCVLWFVAPGKQGQPDGDTLGGFAGNSFSDSSEDGGDALAF